MQGTEMLLKRLMRKGVERVKQFGKVSFLGHGSVQCVASTTGTQSECVKHKHGL